MRESILLINFQDKKKLREIQMMAMAVKLRMKLVDKSDYLQPVGYLAGNKEIPPVDARYEGEELEQEMMVFAGLTEDHLNQMLFLMRKSGIAPVNYKAILTDTNKNWTVPELYEELQREHEAMTKKEG
ncbi:DUF3783 domain-containing protein [Bariatricus massiliensis]|uniref:DUF3783 domain-containing protein n=1 Tax=Bariatricus massiliensis TaxID=1745713 RepID=A0ABS8DKS2_9FIRM|nr:DUF3783 domain-containing protein [Bariatricus massiliensis]MCB7305913.1 DUF3783 domain-containing protein [Bariatricus massiliensis]MCB7376497.1 DUF3783 domain-containing protein [Bariatricus massiliensis]MCB7389056.1 DUF3783 domain-containing protein [Bariatricus massiliensis]MCB7413229.1 DUF3783 domain-containing protein [Bariatricus massiliensis]MCQ5255125.1 DUF3783 domain-containing protein [Bariatricus massiliensis]